MEIGKLPNDVLEKIVISKIENKRDDVISRSGIGEDNAIIDFGDEVCVLSTDPITGATKDIGSLAVHISCNDVSTSGGEAVGVLITLLAPPTAKLEEIEEIMKDASRAAKEVNIEIVGGHTEITDAVNRIVVSSTVIGRQKKSKLPNKAAIAIGDKVLMTKSAAIEGTSILLKEGAEFFKKYLTREDIEIGRALDSQLSVVKEGQIAGDIGVRYMHDITEGGVLGAVWEGAKVANKGILIYEDKIPVMDITKNIAQILDIDPLRLISSGSMLIIVDGRREEELKLELLKNNIDVATIGEIIHEGIFIEKDSKRREILAPESDELYRALQLIY